MRKSRLLLALSLMLCLGLGGCKSSPAAKSSSEPTSSEVTSSESSSSSSSSSGSSSSSSGESSSSSSSEEVVQYTAAKVCEDFNASLAAQGYSLAAEWDETYQEYGLAVNFGSSSDESEENLGNGAYTLASFLPSYMAKEFEVYGDPTSEDYYDLFGDGSIYYYMSFTSPDELSGATVISYVYNGLLIAQISIADVAE